MFWVLHEWDMATEGETEVPKMQIKRAEKFMARWREFIEPDHREEKEMYRNFK